MDGRTLSHPDIGGSKQVHVMKIGDKVILEPLESSPSDVLAWREPRRAERPGLLMRRLIDVQERSVGADKAYEDKRALQRIRRKYDRDFLSY